MTPIETDDLGQLSDAADGEVIYRRVKADGLELFYRAVPELDEAIATARELWEWSWSKSKVYIQRYRKYSGEKVRLDWEVELVG